MHRSRLNYGRTVCYECSDDGYAVRHPSEKQVALRANATVALRVDVARFWSEMMAPAFARVDAVSPINRLWALSTKRAFCSCRLLVNVVLDVYSCVHVQIWTLDSICLLVSFRLELDYYDTYLIWTPAMQSNLLILQRCLHYRKLLLNAIKSHGWCCF